MWPRPVPVSEDPFRRRRAANDDASTGSWNADRSKLTVSDFDGDGKADVGVLYHYGQDEQGVNRTGLWTFTSTGTGFNAPAMPWDSARGTGSWNWYRSDLA
ncbi:hypothetical protein [Streptomyces sp. WM6368]|uniref:hypothetical protein n=1 Tax=Streptomyces sp. WM6368 TaxID=1415554 RepID=UPI0006AF1EF1|nr:hypothetical protein [Streptomyces sp. WM6368]KOU37142.1 hypothetical protein ADK51_00540 [Streptomyces sp. WM6368]